MNDEILKQILEKVEDNSRMIKKINSRMRTQGIISATKWIVYIIILYVTYSFAMTNLAKVTDLYSSVKSTSDTVTDLKEKTSSLDVKSMLDLLNR